MKNSGKTLTITGYSGPAGTVVIPTNINGLLVTSIGSNVFNNLTALTNITIPDSVTNIGYSAFGSCSGLTSVMIPNSVINIADSAFYNCFNLTSVTIPNGVISIGNVAFNSCSGLTNLTIPNSVTNIGDSAFGSCSSLTNITIPGSVTSIGDSAFASCSSLTNITIPDSVTNIGDTAFAFCSRLDSVTIPDSVTSIGNSVFANCYSLNSVTIPDSVTSIGDSAFLTCFSLTNVTIPSSVTSIGDSAFYSCSMDSVTIPDSVTSIGDSAFSVCDNLTNVTIPSSVTSIGIAVFASCSTLNSVTIPDSVTSIGDSAFSRCFSLTNVTIPDSVTSIGDSAFYSCSMDNVTIPDSVTSIGNSAFTDCSAMTSVTIPYSVINMQNAFSGSGLTSATIADGATSIGNLAFTGCANLTNVTIPNSVTSIGELAFSNCISLASFTIPSNIANIGQNAFSGSGLTSVIIANGVTSIGDSAFAGCSYLTNVTIPASVTSIGDSAFAECTSLTSVTIPTSITNIGSYAYMGCIGLSRITVGSSVVSIGDHAFEECTNLVGASFTGNPPSVGMEVFTFDYSLTIYYLLGTTGWSSTFAGFPTKEALSPTPQIQLLYRTNIISNGQTNAVDFGSIQMNQTGPIITFTVTNTGEQPLHLEGITVPPDYMLNTNFPSTIAPVSSGTFSAALGSNMIGIHSGSVTITCNDPTNSPFIFAITGVVTPPAPQIQVWYRTNVIGNGQTNAVDFGSVQINYTGPIMTFTVTNTGEQPLDLEGITVPPNYTLNTNFPSTIAPGSSGAFSVELGSNTIGTYSGSVTITCNDPTNSPFMFAITGAVTPPAPQIQVLYGTNFISNGQTNAVDFGTVQINQIGPIMIFTITNTGEQTLNLEGIIVPSGYTLNTNFPSTIAPGDSGAFSVELNSTPGGTNSGNIIITNNDPDNNLFSFPITGFVATKIISLSGNLAFGPVHVPPPANYNQLLQNFLSGLESFSLVGAVPGSSLPSGPYGSNTITISNAGNTTLTVTNFSCPAGFSVSPLGENYGDGFGLSGIILPGTSQSFSVWFVPTSTTAYGGVMTVGSDATGGINTIPISGYGDDGTTILRVSVSGNGAVSPNLNGEFEKSGTDCTLTAIPRHGAIFTSWSGSITSSMNPLTFKMKPGTVLQANFVTNPFLPFTGSYNGLFTTTNGVTEQTAGMLKGLTINQWGTYSGTLLINGGSHPVSGSFNIADQQATNHIPRSIERGGPLTVDMTLLSLSNSTPQISGTVSNAAWVADLLADIATNTVASAEYTMLIPPDTNNAPPDLSPGGDGYVLITNHLGMARITGALADGAAFNQTVPVSQDGYVPFYDTLYGNKGLLLGWVNLEAPNTNGAGLTWIHPEMSRGLYTNSFTNIFLANQILLSPWTDSPATISLLTNLSMFDTINDTNTLTNIAVNIDTMGKVSGPEISGAINLKTGLLKVTFGSGANKTTGYGAILENATNGGGYFLTPTNAQAIQLTQ